MTRPPLQLYSKPYWTDGIVPAVDKPVIVAPQPAAVADDITCADDQGPEIIYQTGFEPEDNYDEGGIVRCGSQLT